MGRLMALDVGDRRIGIAVSDPLGLTAQGLETWQRRGLDQDIAHIAALIKEYDVTLLVVGQPRNMNGTLGPQAEKVAAFAEHVKAGCQIDVVFQDERLTTMAAHRVLTMGEVSPQKRKAAVDRMAAALILQSYMDGKGNRSGGHG